MRPGRLRLMRSSGGVMPAVEARAFPARAVFSGPAGGVLAARHHAAALGLDRPSHSGHDPVWLNVWDRHDVLSFPIEPFYAGAEIRDLYPDHSDSLLGAHEAYWRASSVHRLLAANWG